MAKTNSCEKCFLVLMALATLACQTGAIKSRDGSDCLTTRMLTTNGMRYETRFEVYRYFRLASGSSTADCVQACLQDSACRSFSYQKLTKWCYLSISDDEKLKKTSDGKWICGYKDDCPSWLKSVPPPAPADCNRYRMLSIDNSALKGGAILETVSLVPNGDTKECLNRCNSNSDCYAYNYLKVEKVCVLISTEYDDLELGITFKWSSGYKWGCRRAMPPPPPNYAVKVELAAVGQTFMTMTISGTSYFTMAYQAVCIASGGTCPTDVASGARSPLLPAPVPYDTSFITSLTVEPLESNSLYTCFVQTQADVLVTGCSEGVTVLTLPPPPPPPA
ncbi:hypothetical protein Ndes2526B_g02739 [Nannochloris sp. 'desiccata']|nr:hypothetical protein NADE_004518 [Chlorella desiccata (nom. nud.)]